jgi:histidinol phosphatase-like PHP family hydrolase
LPNYDLHTHTVYCGHAEDDATVPNLIARAHDVGLAYLGISEHVMNIMDVDCLKAVRDDLDSITSTGVRVLFGAEMDADTTDPAGIRVAPEVACDYIILSAHGFPRFDLEIPESDRQLPVDLQRRNLARKWLAWYKNAASQPGIHILGHPLREPVHMGLIPLQDVELFEEVVDAFLPAIDRGVAFELNNSFLDFLYGTHQYEPYTRLICELRKRGMRFSRGSDAHSAASLGASDAIARVAAHASLTPADWLDPAGLIR